MPLTNDELLSQLHNAAARGWGTAMRGFIKEAEKRGLKVRLTVGNASSGTSPYRDDRLEIDSSDGPDA